MELIMKYVILNFIFVFITGLELPCPEGQTSDTGFTPGCKFDPCLQSNYRELNNYKRSVGYNAESTICDAFLTSGWYRPVSEAGNMMPTECPVDGFTCGTTYPIWMNGTYPATGATSNVTSCTADPEKGCCFESYDIQVKNCGEFYVYNLVTTFGCDTAYCFGNELPCPIDQTSENGFTPGCEFDPCLEYNYEELDNFKRSVGYNDKSTICDAFLMPGWYRPVSKAGNMMPTECPVNNLACGAFYPIWMNGTHPAEGITANVTGCMADSENGCCLESYDIQVKNCGEFYVYYLMTTSGCDTAYCFGKEMPCPIGQTSKNGFSPGCEFDPCQNYDIIDGEYRRSSDFILHDETPIDDSTLESGWYKFDSYVGNDLVNRSQEMMRCGTIFPVWINGDIPSEKATTVNRTCCVTGTNDTCEKTTSIQIRNCGEFRVYNLSQLQQSYSGYCVGSLPVTSTTTETPKTSTELMLFPPIDKSIEEKPDPAHKWFIVFLCGAFFVCCIVLLAFLALKYLRKKTIHTPLVSCQHLPTYKEVMNIKKEKNEVPDTTTSDQMKLKY